MKKSFIILSTTLLLFCVGAFATGGDTVPAKVKNAFEKSFSGILNVNWEKVSDLYFAHFKLNEQDAEAVYNEAGVLMSTSRKVAFEQLPMKVFMAVAEKYKGYTISPTAKEIVTDDQTRYNISAENDKYILILECNTAGEIAENSRLKK